MVPEMAGEIQESDTRPVKTIVALVPARGGSVRIPRKAIKKLKDKPLIAYTIACAHQSDIFTDVLVCTDDEEIADVARRYGADDVIMRRDSPDNEPDYAWIWPIMKDRPEDAFAILRPTSPFRQPDTLQRAWTYFQRQHGDSLRAIERARQHPGKMWVIHRMACNVKSEGLLADSRIEETMHPLLPWTIPLNVRYEAVADGERYQVPWHSCPTQSLPEVYVQNASLEMAWRYVLFTPGYWAADINTNGTISGATVIPFELDGHDLEGCEGFDLNTAEDWVVAEWLLDKYYARLPFVSDPKPKKSRSLYPHQLPVED